MHGGGPDPFQPSTRCAHGAAGVAGVDGMTAMVVDISAQGSVSQN
ncbi:hypothetical protein I551_5617 [Mycobacterium ulcerans str. Harvey]|uniref:Uncharacterized protein n=1 Tax=Mycobacterium ulcerans str. Harvey TaxID=1299332 RepID=A0ABN0QTD1_MYCUL|nr:hypothetical protein I551_5617 [Mycobacterium ulcerans str. Harvey]